LKEASKLLHNFRGRRIEPIGSISLAVSFGSLHNAHTKHITFNVVGMRYPYNTIFIRGLLNTFEAALHYVYLCLKVPAALGVISIHGNQKEARNIEQGFTPGQKNVNCLQDGKIEICNDIGASRRKEAFTNKLAIKPKCETKRVLLDPRVLDRIMLIS
jgi:hypothetical protein